MFQVGRLELELGSRALGGLKRREKSELRLWWAGSRELDIWKLVSRSNVEGGEVRVERVELAQAENDVEMLKV